MTRRRKYRPSRCLVLLTLVLAAVGAGRARADRVPAPSPVPAAGAPAAPLAAPAAASSSTSASSSAPDSAAAGAAPAPAAAQDSTTPAASGKDASPTAPGKETFPTAPDRKISNAAPSKEIPPAAPAKEAPSAGPGEKSEAAASAGADPGTAPPPSQSANATLKALTEAGVRLYERGDFAGAIQSFLAGYALRPKPVFLFNIAQAYRKSGQDQNALSFYGKFIAASPQSQYRAEAEAYIAYLRGKLGLDRPPPRPPRVYKKGWFWAVLGTAAVTAGVAVTLGIVLGTQDPPTTLGTVEPRFR